MSLSPLSSFCCGQLGELCQKKHNNAKCTNHSMNKQDGPADGHLGVSLGSIDDFVSFSLPITSLHFNTDELLNMRDSSEVHFLPLFTNPKGFSEILVGGTAAVYRVARRHRPRWAKREGPLIKLRKRGLCTALPTIHLVNVFSLANKMDELLRLLISKNLGFDHSAALCFSQTHLT